MNSKPEENTKIIRILGIGQFKVDSDIILEANRVDNEIVRLLEDTESNPTIKEEFDKKIRRIYDIITEKGIKIESQEIVTSDIIVPGKDITVEEARELFRGEGIIEDI